MNNTAQSSPKKSYLRPTVTVLGSIAELTKAGGSPGKENTGDKKTKLP